MNLVTTPDILKIIVLDSGYSSFFLVIVGLAILTIGWIGLNWLASAIGGALISLGEAIVKLANPDEAPIVRDNGYGKEQIYPKSGQSSVAPAPTTLATAEQIRIFNDHANKNS